MRIVRCAEKFVEIRTIAPSSSNIDIIEKAQSNILTTITGAPWYIRDENLIFV